MTPAPQHNDRTEKREAILAAALELFSERGFHGTAMPELAEKAGVGAGTIYRYFEGKEALVNVLYQENKRLLLHALVDDFPFAAPAREQFHALWMRLFRFAMERPKALKFLELQHHAEYLDEESRLLEARSLDPALGFLELTRKSQITKDVPAPILISIVWGAFVRLVRASWEGTLELSPEAIEQAEACCWEAIRR